jgi:hypothetical protein
MEGTLQFAQVGETTAIYPASRPARGCSRLDSSLTTRMSGKVWLLTCISPKSRMGGGKRCVEITYRASYCELPASSWRLPDPCVEANATARQAATVSTTTCKPNA